MKTLLTNILYLFIGVLLFSSCNSIRSVTYTDEVKAKYQLDSEDLEQMQFYLSGEIILKRSQDATSMKRFNKNGTLIISNASDYDVVIIDEKTKGVVSEIYDNKLAIKFFFDDPTKILYFGDLDGNGKYRLLAKNWKDGKGEIDLGGQTYYTTDGSSSAYLEFRTTKKDKRVTHFEVARGKKVNN